MEIVALVVVVVFAGIAVALYQQKRRREYLMGKYGGDAELVAKLMAKKVWQGMTEGQLVDSWGRPAAVEEKILKTKTTLTFKYNQNGKNRYRSRVRLENGLVVGWEQK